MKTGYNIGVNGIPWILKAPGAQLDYTVDWGQWLAADETIVSLVAAVAPSGLTKVSESPSPDGKRATVELAGGTAGAVHRVALTITTSDDRTDTRSFDVRVQQR